MGKPDRQRKRHWRTHTSFAKPSKSAGRPECQPDAESGQGEDARIHTPSPETDQTASRPMTLLPLPMLPAQIWCVVGLPADRSAWVAFLTHREIEAHNVCREWNRVSATGTRYRVCCLNLPADVHARLDSQLRSVIVDGEAFLRDQLAERSADQLAKPDPTPDPAAPGEEPDQTAAELERFMSAGGFIFPGRQPGEDGKHV